MNSGELKAVIVSASSDIGAAMCERWRSRGWKIYGTYRTESHVVEKSREAGDKLIHCDLNVETSVKRACRELREKCARWDVLVLCPAALEPVGSFTKCDFDEWERSVKINFTNQLRIMHELLPTRNAENEIGPCVLFFAGGGINKATVNYSSYTVSKIALIKMCELLDAEIRDARFMVLGPGWVKTKIHNATIQAGSLAGDNYEKTKYMLENNVCTPMKDVLDCCDWLIKSPKQTVSGRNFSVVFDMWKKEELAQKLEKNYDMYKLRRFGNEWLI